MNITVLPVGKIDDVDEVVLHKQMLEFGKATYVQVNKEHFLVVGVKKDQPTIEDVRSLGGSVRTEVQSLSCTEVICDFDKLSKHVNFSSEETVAAFMEGWHLGGYEFLHYKKDAKEKVAPKLNIGAHFGDVAKRAKIRAEAVIVARDLCNEPANKLTPEIYAERIEKIFSGTKVAVEIVNEADLDEYEFHATATVGRGSENEAKVAVLTLENADTARVGLVGKGVTFDSGGTNVKTGNDIGEMKMDMGGSAAVVGSMKLLADLDSPVNVFAVIPMVTNVAGGSAFLPSDVIEYANGMTIEVGNTDAEGRLVLADGIVYAQKNNAETIIDIATLTGAIGVSLGLKMAGIFSNEEADLWSYKQLGEQTGDYVWPMPVIDDYKTYLESDCADLNNMSSNAFGGAITAALFLKQFVESENRWIHVDMANTVRPWKTGGYYVDGAAGFGVRLLTELVQKYS